MSIPLLIDTDPGVDDAVAIWLALASPELDVVGLSVVFGNGHAAPCAENAVRILDAAGRSRIPVHIGADRPLTRSYARQGWGVHGADGLGGIGLAPASRKPDGMDAVAWMAERLEEAAPSSLTLAPIGPLTNIARLLSDYPQAKAGIREMVVMGGAATPNGGNATAHAEYNFWLDPEAADIVCQSGVPMILVTIETARPVSATPARIARIEAAGSKVARHVADLLRAYVHESKADALFDPLVVAYLLRPDLFGRSYAHFRVESGTSPRLGALAWRPAQGPTPHVLLQAPDPDTIFDFLAARFRHLP
ncbi:nucleoside hydrolase [Dongia sp.]|uniref:nucleoside hydrolase n=1 Tax=Dongia sp. TaxID=1977262 RepID=UPI0035B1B794